MFQAPNQGANSPADSTAESPRFETGRHLVFGSPGYIRVTIKLLHVLHYAEANDWSRPLPTGRPNEVMAILTKKVRLD